MKKLKSIANRRLLPLLMAALLIIGLTPASIVSADAPEAVLTASGASVETGENVNISLAVRGISYASIQAAISYDADAFEYKSVTAPGAGGIADVSVGSGSSAGTLQLTRYGPGLTDGDIAATLTFAAKAATNAAQFTATEVYVAAGGGTGAETKAEDAAEVSVAVTAGGFTFKVGDYTGVPAPGNYIDLPLYVTKNPGFLLWAFELSYDHSALVLDRVTARNSSGSNIGGVNDPRFYNSNLKDRIILGGESLMPENFTVYLRFMPKTQSGTYTVSMTHYQPYCLTIDENSFDLSGVSAAPGTLVFTGDPYLVTVADGIQNGTVTVPSGAVMEGQSVYPSIVPASGHRFKDNSLRVVRTDTNAAVPLLSGGNGFAMPAASVTVTAEFEEVEQHSITLNRTGDEGAVEIKYSSLNMPEVDFDDVIVGAAIYVTATGTYEWRAKTLSVTTDDGAVTPYAEGTYDSNKYVRFYMPNADVTITVEFEDISEYDVTLPADTEYGSVAADTARAKEGEAVTFSATPLSGYRLANNGLTITTDEGEDLAYASDGEGEFRFIMPAGDVTLDAVFEPIPYGGAGTEESPYLITSLEEFLDFRDSVDTGVSYNGVFFKLTTDVDLSAYPEWKPVGQRLFFARGTNEPGTGTTYDRRSFDGTFDGGGRTVTLGIEIPEGAYYLNKYQDYEYYFYAHGKLVGLFGYTKNAVLKNITTDGYIYSETESASWEIGALVGNAALTRIDNCVNKADITVTYRSAAHVGGIAGQITTDDETGFAGAAPESYGLYNCVNSGTLDIYSNPTMYLGGLAGIVRGNVYRSANTGNIYVRQTAVGVYGYATGGYIGGLSGNVYQYAGDSGSYERSISESCNTGNIYAPGNTISGLAPRSASVAVRDCYNTGNIDNYGSATTGSQIRMAGISEIAADAGIFENCYNTGSIKHTGGLHSSGGSGEKHPVLIGEITLPHKFDGAPFVNISLINCYISTDTFTAAELGRAFKDDINGINGGYPLLKWQSDEVPDTEYDISFGATPSNAVVTVYKDAARTLVIEPRDGGAYSLKGVTYYYSVGLDGYVTEEASFRVTQSAVIQIALRPAAAVTFTVTPPDAAFELTKPSSAGAVAPESAQGGAYAYTLYAGDVYEYTASADGYNSTAREFEATDGKNISVTLTPSSQGTQNIQGGETISAGGVYNVIRKDGEQGVITITTAEPVTLVGTGTAEASAYRGLYISYTVAGANLTARDIYIGNSSVDTAVNMINFTGADNKLNYEGTSILDQSTGVNTHAMIRVPQGAELTVTGESGAELYMYKRGQAAAIGGDANECNGDITFSGGKLFAKNTMQGALIGSGTNAQTGTPGRITILSGEMNLIAVSRSAAIGGSAGSGGANAGTNVYIRNGANVNINIDFSGAAIGGGGYAGGNDAGGGTLHYGGGSIRTFIDYNAVDPDGDGDTSDSLWKGFGVAQAGVNDAAITASKVDAADRPVYLFIFDTAQLSGDADTFEVYDVTINGTYLIYSGGLHRYSFVNENRQKNSQIGVSYTIDNWVSLSDPNLYLYLTGEDHTLTVNGETFAAVWENTSKSFAVNEGERYNITVGANLEGGTLTAGKSRASAGEKITVSVQTNAGYRLIEGSIQANAGAVTVSYTAGVYSFTMPGSDVTVTAEFEPIPTGAAKYAVTVSGASGGAVTADKAEAAEGETVTVTVTPDAGKQLTAGSLKANGNAITATGGVYSFLMPTEPVTITAQFETIPVTAPNGTKLKAGAAQDIVLRIAKDFELFDASSGLTLNGTKLPADAFSVTSGSTVVTVNATYLNTLASDSYTLTVPFKDGTAVPLDFTISVNPLFDVSIDPAITNGTLTPDKAAATEAETVTVTVTPDAGYRLVAGSLKYDGRAINAGINGKYTFTMPAWDVTLTAQFIEAATPGGTTPTPDDPLFENGIRGTGNIYASPWDGKSLDLTWFDPDANSYTISTPAQLAGLAALVNGLYNKEIDTVAGNASYIRVHTGFGDDDGPAGNNKSTPTYHYGEYNFAGKTVCLDNNINMGSANYMPIGGQYLMEPNDATTRIDASFNGVFDGQGHTVTVNANRHVSTGNYGDGQSVGLIGRLGVHDNDDSRLLASGLAVRNVVVRGSVSANRSVGGVVGKIGKTADNYAVIENCANFAIITATDAKGTGGIVGAGWNGGVIRNCYNAVAVTNQAFPAVAGISGSNEVTIENSYNVGKITGPGLTAAIASENGGGAYVNVYWIDGSASVGVYNSGADALPDGAKLAASYMRSDEFVTKLGPAFVKDTGNINSGYPVLVYQGGTAVAPAAPGESGNNETAAPGNTTVEKGTATTVVDEPIKLTETPTLVVVNVETNGATVNTITAEVTAANVKAVAENGSAIEVRSDLGNVTLPNEAVKALSGSAEKKVDVKLTKSSADTYTLALTADDKAVQTVDGGVKLTIPSEDTTPGTVAILIRADGTEEVIKKSVGKDGKVSIPLDGSATIKIVDNSKDFADVSSNAWYSDGVKFTSSHELFQGTDDGGFAPEMSMTRGMLATVLHRLEHAPTATGELFADVAEGAYYAEAIIWASANSIVNGTGTGFAPDAEINREQLAVMLYRYYVWTFAGDGGRPGTVAPTDANLSAFPDADGVSDWAEDAVIWAVGIGLINGRDSGLAPQGTATRAEVAVILERFIENIL